MFHACHLTGLTVRDQYCGAYSQLLRWKHEVELYTSNVNLVLASRFYFYALELTLVKTDLLPGNSDPMTAAVALLIRC